MLRCSVVCCGILRCVAGVLRCRVVCDSHQKGEMVITIVKTPGSQVESLVAEGNRREGGGRKMRDES